MLKEEFGLAGHSDVDAALTVWEVPGVVVSSCAVATQSGATGSPSVNDSAHPNCS